MGFSKTITSIFTFLTITKTFTMIENDRRQTGFKKTFLQNLVTDGELFQTFIIRHMNGGVQVKLFSTIVPLGVRSKLARQNFKRPMVYYC